jgi:hypothetical protein
VERVAGRDRLVGRLAPSPLKQSGSSFAKNKIRSSIFNFFTAMNLKVGFKNPRRLLNIISL